MVVYFLHQVRRHAVAHDQGFVEGLVAAFAPGDHGLHGVAGKLGAVVPGQRPEDLIVALFHQRVGDLLADLFAGGDGHQVLLAGLLDDFDKVRVLKDTAFHQHRPRHLDFVAG